MFFSSAACGLFRLAGGRGGIQLIYIGNFSKASTTFLRVTDHPSLTARLDRVAVELDRQPAETVHV